MLIKTRYDLIIPVGARSVKYISRHIKKISKLTKVFVADITKAKNLIGWKPKVSLEQGIRKLIKWIEHIKN